MDENKKDKEAGNLVAIIVIIGLLLAGAVYAYFKVQDMGYLGPSKARILHRQNITPQNDPVIKAPESDSTSPVDIEKDLDMTDLDTIDKDLEALDNI